MLAFVIVSQVVVALFLIGVVLLQPGNRGGASAALGGAGSDTVFGARGANTFLSKITFGAAVCFIVTNFALSFMSSHTDASKISGVLEQQASSSGGVGTEPVPSPAVQEAVPPTKAGEPAQEEQPALPKDAEPSDPAKKDGAE